jgi:4-hydroxy-tetrahydrodipicolinate reductase
MGTVARTALERAGDFDVCGGLARAASPSEHIYDDIAELLERERPDLLLDLTVHPASVEIVVQAAEHGVAPVVGTTGWGDDERERLRSVLERRGIGGLLVPNFAIGAVLMMRFARDAAGWFHGVEIIELHHDGKRDAPSGTAKLTAERIRERREGSIPIHSVRLRGLVAHQEVLFGNDGEVLTIRHDALSREAFVPGMLLALRRVRSLRGLHVGLEAVLEW